MPDCFEILHKDLAGRIGRLRTPHGMVETPLFMPVVNPHLLILKPSEIARIGADMLITNSYIIGQDPELREKALADGVHSLLGFDGPVMTDSGAFQLSVYGEIDVEPLEILEFQMAIGSDVSVPLDIPTPPDVPRDRVLSELSSTEKRLLEAASVERNGLLAGPIQGSTQLDLREAAARRAGEMNFDIYPIGAVVPLMESYRFKDLVQVVASSKVGLGPGAPVHLFGAGHPMVFALGAALGCDLFDSAAYALYARDGRYLTPTGTWKVEDLLYLPCCCPVCVDHDVKDLQDGERGQKLLAMHNLHVSFQEMRLVKQMIWEGSLWDLLEARSRAHPRLLDGLKALSREARWLEGLDRSSKSTFFYLGPESATRPEVIRHQDRMKRLKVEGEILVSDDPRASAEGYDSLWGFKVPFGPYPIELSETQPLNAEVPQMSDCEGIDMAALFAKRLIAANPDARFHFRLRSVPDIEERLRRVE
ncbi:MAG: tRNA guanosine(15) transglycosylase TgtA [Methanotrichaceae archaeon]|nr:tRNA guanosine(15) transglycosylase TgtA [Methanotrichaceae archaeon]